MLYKMEIFSLILVNLLVYGPTIWFGLVMDDMQWWDIRKKEGFSNPLNIKNYQQLIACIHERLYSGTTFGMNSKVEHAFTIFLHTTICVLIYLAFGSNSISYGAALLYAVNPINNQTSIWLNGRRYAINIILVLLMILLKPWGMILYPLTFIFQVTAIFSPILSGNWWSFLPVILVTPLFWKKISVTVKVRASAITNGEMLNFNPRRIIVIIKSFGSYFFKMIVPGICGMVYPYLFYWDKTKEGNKDAYSINFDFYRGVGAFAVVGIATYFIPSALRPWALFLILSTLQWCNIIAVMQTFADRYMSLPNVFVMFFLSYGFHQLPEPYGNILQTLLIFYYSMCTLSLLPMYKNILEFYLYHVNRFKNIPWPRVLLIGSLIESGRLPEAQHQAAEGIKYNSKDFGILMYGAILCLLKGKLDASLTLLDECENNMYLGQEKTQMEEISHLRQQISIIKNNLPDHKDN